MAKYPQTIHLREFNRANTLIHILHFYVKEFIFKWLWNENPSLDR